MAEKSRESFAAVSDIGELPAVENPERKDACKTDLLRFLVDYFPQTTGLKPFSEDHIRAIGRIQQCVMEGGLFVEAFPRGFAKTTISENSAIWAVLYGHRAFVPIFGADASSADGNIDSIKIELAENELLYADFPEICHAIRALEGKPQRCGSQTYQGRLTHIEWTSDTIVLPTIPGSPASASIITASGITGASRGMKHKKPDGTQQRPDFVIIDDPQTDESASTPLQVSKRLNVIRKSILKLGGHNRRIAVVMNATVIRPDDLVEQLLDQKKFPAWQGERIKMVRQWSDVHETLWLGDYARIRNTFDPNILGDQQRAHHEATEFYRLNREKMDAGCLVAWEHCYDGIAELSAIQHAYNSLIDDGPEVFASECQNEPFRDEIDESENLSADFIAKKLNGMGRGIVPAGVSRLVAFIDVQKNALYWVVAGFEDGFTGYILDYGIWPDQKNRDLPYAKLRQTIQKTLKIDNLEAAIYGALDSCVKSLSGKEWRRDDGAAMRLERIAIDSGWGESTDTVRLFCRQSQQSSILLPSKGMYVGAKSKSFNDYKPKPGERYGVNWRIPNVSSKTAVRHLLYDTNSWKTFVMSRLRTGMGGKGCLSLFGNDHRIHEMFASHIVAEIGTRVEAKGRSLIEWELKAFRPDNHWLDGVVGCHVLAAVQGVKLMEETRKTERRIVKVAELQKKAKHHGPRAY